MAPLFYVLDCCHDNTVVDWEEHHNKLERVYNQTELKIVIDSVFPSFNVDYLIKSLHDDLAVTTQFEFFEKQVANIAMKREIIATGMQLCSKWRMRAV
jgi:hypothetical protein